jgi:hypothetical protein
MTEDGPGYVEQLCVAVLTEFGADRSPLMPEPVAVVLACCGQSLWAAPASVRQRLVSIVLRHVTLLPELQQARALKWRQDLALESSVSPSIAAVYTSICELCRLRRIPSACTVCSGAACMSPEIERRCSSRVLAPAESVCWGASL